MLQALLANVAISLQADGGHNHSDDKSYDSDDSAYSSRGAQPVTRWGRRVAGLTALALPASPNTLVQPDASPQASLLQSSLC